MEHTFCGLNRSQMNEVLNVVCSLKDRIELTEEEKKAFDIGIQCICQILNRMTNNQLINWD